MKERKERKGKDERIGNLATRQHTIIPIRGLVEWIGLTSHDRLVDSEFISLNKDTISGDLVTTVDDTKIPNEDFGDSNLTLLSSTNELHFSVQLKGKKKKIRKGKRKGNRSRGCGSNLSSFTLFNSRNCPSCWYSFTAVTIVTNNTAIKIASPSIQAWPPSSPSSAGAGAKIPISNEMRAAMQRIMMVVSWQASHHREKKVLRGFCG